MKKQVSIVSINCRNKYMDLLGKLKVTTVPCCDICNPELLNLTRPAAPRPNSRKKTVPYEAVNPEIKLSLKQWRTDIWSRDFEDAIFSAAGILSDVAIDKLSSVVSPIENLISLERALGGGWAWFGTYGDELLDYIKTLPFKSMGPKPKQKRAVKRKAVDVTNEESVAKRTRFDTAPAPAHTPVRSRTTSHLTPAIAGPSTAVPGYPHYSPQYHYPQHYANYYYPTQPYPTPPHNYVPTQPQTLMYHHYYPSPLQYRPPNPGPPS
jgi:hypothetical protein